MIPRLIETGIIHNLLTDDKALVMLGARQVGKTTLLRDLEKKLSTKEKRVLYLNCDLDEQKAVINTTSQTILEQLLRNVDILFIDEAQRLDNAGLTLKIIHDNFPRVKILATGSSSFELKNKMSEPMTGRFLDFTLYPLSLVEIIKAQNTKVNRELQKQQANALLPLTMTYGLYPGIYEESDPTKKQIALSKLVESYLFKDILMFQKIRNSQAIKDLAKAIAYQIGSEVNENELANRLKIDRKTVVSYLDILEKAFVIIKVFPYSKNPRREIGKNYKVYFMDIGIRNALIGDFNSPDLRSDLGSLWENFLYIERLKAYANANQPLFEYKFWRSYSGAEVDYIEKPLNGDMKAFEFKYSSATLSRGTHSFTNTYNIPVSLINKENYFDFITPFNY